MNATEEQSKFRPTDKTVVHRGKTYEIFNPPTDETKADSPYILRSPRGRWFALMRNHHKPHLMFGVGLYGAMTCLPGWFTDKDGELKSIG